MFKVSAAFLSVLTLLVFTFSPSRANAEPPQGIYECGVPEKAELDVEAGNHGVCDIFTRQLLFRKEANEFRELVKERQKIFVKTYNEAKNNYDKMLEELDKERGTQPEDTDGAAY